MCKKQTTNKKRILIYGMSDNPGGMEAYIVYMIRKADPSKYQFDLVTVFTEVAYAAFFEERGIKTYIVPAFAKHPIKHIIEVKRLMRNYDLLYMNILDAGAFGTAFGAKFAGKKVLVHSHNSDTDRVRVHCISKPILNMLTDIRYACSDIAGKHMFGNRAYQVIANEIDQGRFSYNEKARTRIRRELEIDKDAFVVCHVGRIVKQKNPYGVIDIFYGVKQKISNAVLLYAGDGDMREEIEEYIEQLNREDPVLQLAKAIKLLGVRGDIPDILSASDVFILPSLYEGNPISVIEAQANGIPCVIADHIALHEETELIYRKSINSEEDWINTIYRMNIRNRTNHNIMIQDKY